MAKNTKADKPNPEVNNTEEIVRDFKTNSSTVYSDSPDNSDNIKQNKKK